jgi:hypothetical protein
MDKRSFAVQDEHCLSACGRLIAPARRGLERLDRDIL